MKNLKLTFILLAFASISTAYATANHSDFISKIVDTVISWKSDSINVGEIPMGVPKEFTFEFTNNTDKPVLVTNVKASCGCTATEYSKEPIASGKKGFVKATYNAAHAGAFTKTVTVTSSDSETPKKLTIKGTVLAK